MKQEIRQMIAERVLFPEVIINHERERNERPIITAVTKIRLLPVLAEEFRGKEIRKAPDILNQPILKDELVIVPKKRIVKRIGVDGEGAENQQHNRNGTFFDHGQEEPLFSLAL